MSVLAGLLAGLSVLVVLGSAGSRLAVVLPRPSAPPSAARPRASPALTCGVAGAALALLVGLPAGAAIGLLLAVGGPRLLARLEPAGVRAERELLAADLPLVLDLLASCLAGGASLSDAADAVAAAVPGPAGRRLAGVSAQLAVGTPPALAWAALTRTAAPGVERDPLAPAARALGRAAEGGAPVADAVARLAADARAQARAQGEQAARRVGVLVVAPLGLCFLPAFVLLGVVPVVAGLLGPLLETF